MAASFSRDQLRDLLIHHAPAKEQMLAYEKLLQAAINFGAVLVKVTPPGHAQSAAIQKLRDCVGLANEAIAGPARPV